MADLFVTLNPFYLNVGQIYMQYHYWFDALIALVLFVSLANWVFAKKYGAEHDGHKTASKESKLIGTAIGVALTFGFAYFEISTGFMLADLHPVAVLILLLMLGIFLYEILLAAFGDEKKACAFALTYIILFGFFTGVNAKALGTLLEHYRLVWGIINIGFLAAFIKFIMCIIGMFTGGGSHGEHGGHDGAHAEEHGEEHDKGHEPHAPLAVQIYQPLPNSTVDEGNPIPITARISGGSGKYVWFIRGNFEKNYIQPSQGNSADVHAQLIGLPHGEYEIQVIVEDGEHHAHDHLHIHVHEKHEAHDTTEVMSHINEFATQVSQFVTAQKQFAVLGNHVLHTHHQNSQPGRNSATQAAYDAAWAQFQSYSLGVAGLMQHLSEHAEVLGRDEHIAHLSVEQAANLGAIFAQYYDAAAAFDAYWSVFASRYTRAEAPA